MDCSSALHYTLEPYGCTVWVYLFDYLLHIKIHQQYFKLVLHNIGKMSNITMGYLWSKKGDEDWPKITYRQTELITYQIVSDKLVVFPWVVPIKSTVDESLAFAQYRLHGIHNISLQWKANVFWGPILVSFSPPHSSCLTSHKHITLSMSERCSNHKKLMIGLVQSLQCDSSICKPCSAEINFAHRASLY